MDSALADPLRSHPYRRFDVTRNAVPTGSQPAATAPQTPDTDAPRAHGETPAPAAEARRFVDPDDELALPLHKRVVAQYAKNDDGATELRLFYGDKEISFDEPDLFGFGEALARQSRFVAREATQWGQGQDWDRVREMLEQLIDAGILYPADEVPDERLARTTADGARPSPLPPAPATVARTWQDCESITRELTGRPLELGYLELVIPIFRVVHMCLDADGRQVGEANVFPKALRLDIPTRWRACIYAGTRHLDAKPMNVTALKAMRDHWGQMMVAILRIREAFLRRYPEARAGWTVGHLERLSTAILAVPTFQLMRMQGGVANGALHPALSSLFRVTDGVRMTMHQMLFIPIGEPTTLPDAPVTAVDILDYAERNYSFHSEHGVCAGPRAMMEEFLAVLLEGMPARNADGVVLDPAVEAALADVEAAIDYGLLGLRAYAAVFSIWPVMTRAYERLWSAITAWQAAGAPARVDALVEHLRSIMESLRESTYLGTEQWRVDREQVYADMYYQCGRGLGLDEASDTLTYALASRRDGPLQAISQQLQDILARHFAIDATSDRSHLHDLVDCIVEYIGRERAMLGVASDVQTHINRLLGRTPPQLPFQASQVDIHVLLQGRDVREVPNLGDELERIFGIDVTIERDRVEIRG